MIVLPVPASTVNLVLLTAKSLVTSKVPVTSKLPPTEASSTTIKSSPTYKSKPIPAPPPTIKVPVDEFVALVVSNSFRLPASIPDLVPENTSEELVASSYNANLLTSLSQPNHPSLAEPL